MSGSEGTKLWYLKNINLLRGMSAEQMAMVESHTVMREVKRKEVLYLPGDAGDRIYLLKRGVVKISSLDKDGREIILALLRMGEVFGEEAAFDEAPRDHMAEAHEDALLCIINKNDFLQMMRSQPDLAFKVTKLVGFRLKTIRSRVEQLVFKGAPARLATVLLDIAKDHGVPDDDGIRISIRLSQQDLASLIGVSRESVNLALADFRRKGLIEIEGRAIRVKDPEALRRLA